MSSFIRYPGGKTKLREEILANLSDMLDDSDITEYREPFFGGGSIGLEFAKNVKSIWINDKDIGIYALWQSVIKFPEQLKDKVREFKPSVKDFTDFKNYLIEIGLLRVYCESDIVDIGFKKLAIHQISYSGLGVKSGGPLGGTKQESKYKIDCRWSPEYICNKIDATNRVLSEKNITCSSCDFSKVIENDENKSLLYLDPPYYIKGNDLYQCGFTTDDHKKLANCLKETNHLWLLSYDDCEEVREIYSWAKIEPVAVKYSIERTKENKDLKKLNEKTELLITKNELPARNY